MNPKNWNETARAIVGSGVIAVVLSLLLLGNPFRAIGEAYGSLETEASSK